MTYAISWSESIGHSNVCYSTYTYTRLGDRAFPVAGPQLWNSLPSNLRQSDLRPTLQQFRRALKTYSFGWLRLQHLVTFVYSVLYKCSYLLTYRKFTRCSVRICTWHDLWMIDTAAIFIYLIRFCVCNFSTTSLTIILESQLCETVGLKSFTNFIEYCMLNDV